MLRVEAGPGFLGRGSLGWSPAASVHTSPGPLQFCRQNAGCTVPRGQLTEKLPSERGLVPVGEVGPAPYVDRSPALTCPSTGRTRTCWKGSRFGAGCHRVA